MSLYVQKLGRAVRPELWHAMQQDPCDPWPVSRFCTHKFVRVGTVNSSCIVYECTLCGEEEERDVS